jgi:hypothetical protein
MQRRPCPMCKGRRRHRFPAPEWAHPYEVATVDPLPSWIDPCDYGATSWLAWLAEALLRLAGVVRWSKPTMSGRSATAASL